MIDGLAIASREVQPLLIAFDGGAGADFGFDVALHGRLPHNAARNLHAAHQTVTVNLCRKKIGPDGRTGQRVRRLDVDRTH
ncbi:hypothetical protein D3C72_2060060 [compost metagenome]